MSFYRHYCFVPECDGCGPDWWRADVLIGEAPPHYGSEREGRQRLEQDLGWRIRQRPDGTWQTLCAMCADLATCAKRGHDFMDDHAAWLLGTTPACVRCSTPRPDTTTPVGHPESMTADRSAPDKDFFNHLAAELWPDGDASTYDFTEDQP